MLLLRAFATILTIYPLVGEMRRLRLRRRWSRDLVRALDIAIVGDGPPPPAGSVIVANHVSWVDIFAINAVAPASFVAKSEVRAWPVIGWLAARNDTIFVRRASRVHTLSVNRQIADLIARGRLTAMFPEGTTSDGADVLPFHAALLQPAIDAGAQVVPLAIRYESDDGRRSPIPAYVGDTSLVASIAAICRARGLTVRLLWSEPHEVADRHRRHVGVATRAAIRQALSRRESGPVELAA
ncbi:MAG: 1-acyl-sn-glycerol-3-phosphate acyltransferase [Zoogloeaceae bacterium]|nr:1-acyl-sn-glycerol-3-phosphate acyltransferase [Rhodocyclaceae bacterium]MCP5234497.1 1-acyl-sn-glycerol-3-phosphate acyltransferase [Zoogloeaceae bacterium]